MRLIDSATVVIGFVAIAMSVFFSLPIVFGMGVAYVLLGLDIIRNHKVQETLKQLQGNTKGSG